MRANFSKGPREPHPDLVLPSLLGRPNRNHPRVRGPIRILREVPCLLALDLLFYSLRLVTARSKTRVTLQTCLKRRHSRMRKIEGKLNRLPFVFKELAIPLFLNASLFKRY